MELTQSLEDYLEAIWIINLDKKVVRVKDIMKYFSYKVSSVNRALKVLKEKGFVVHEKYEYVELTPNGAALAQKIYDRHKTLTKFFLKILGVDADIAPKDACSVEHYLSEQTYQRLSAFVEYIESQYPEIIENWYRFLKNSESRGSVVRLSKLRKGEKAVIAKIKAGASLKKKFLSMGLLPGEEVIVERVAPLGDPIDILVKGYHLSLRKEEADRIFVKR